MATAQTGFLHPRFATDCVSETLCATVAELCIYSLNMLMIIMTFMLRAERPMGSWFDPWQGQEIFLFSKRPDWHWGQHRRLSSGYRGLFSRELKWPEA
jgi:hypothetical protein